MKLFSVIIPLYNRESLILEALESVKVQDYRPIEIVIIDDGSTDNTKEVVKGWGRKNEADDFTLRYFYQDNAGVGAARNRGIQEVCGKYVQFLDSDDSLYPERLTQLAETFERNRCDFIQTGFEGFDADTGEIIQTAYGKPDDNQVELALKGHFWANTLRAAMTSELVHAVGPWNSEMTCFEDREYMERAVVKASKPVAIRDVLASARRGGSSRISDKLRSYEGRTWRIYCEKCLADATKDRFDVSYEAKQAFASRIYALGFRSNACGWKDLGKQCGDLAESMNVALDALGRRRRLVWRMGRFGGQVYDVLSSLCIHYGRKSK